MCVLTRFIFVMLMALIQELEDKNRELGEEIKFLERDRLEQWGKYEALLKERQRPADLPAATRGLSSSSHFELYAGRDVRTVNDLFAIKDTAETLLRGWQSRGHEDDEAILSAPNPERADERGYENDKKVDFAVDDDEKEDERDFVSSPSTRASGKRPAMRQIEREVVQPGGKREVIFTDGSKHIFFADGNEKEIDADGHTTIRFTNGDRKEVCGCVYYVGLQWRSPVVAHIHLVSSVICSCSPTPASVFITILKRRRH